MRNSALILSLLTLLVVACGAAPDDVTDGTIGQSEEELMIQPRNPPLDTLDCSKNSNCWECGNKDGPVCCVYDPCVPTWPKPLSFSQ